MAYKQFLWQELFLLLLLFNSPSECSQSCMFGDECVFRCHCAGDGPCDVTRGTCPSGCGSGEPAGFHWHGSGCQIGNVLAGNRDIEVGSSSFGKVTVGDRQLHLEDTKAVDGRTNPDIRQEQCALLHSDNERAWWIVDLKKQHVIYDITLFNTNDTYSKHLSNFSIGIGDEPSPSNHSRRHWQLRKVEDKQTFTFEPTAVGRYLSVRKLYPEKSSSLTLCEVAVTAHVYVKADCRKCRGNCDPIIGCSECEAGYTAPGCMAQDCESHPDKCKQECGKCTDDKECDDTTGECSEGCQLWYVTNKCDQFVDVPDLSDTNLQVMPTNSSLMSFWDKYRPARTVSSEVLRAYGYDVMYRKSHSATDPTWKIAGSILTGEGTGVRKTFKISELMPNTYYDVHVIPFRQLGSTRDGGIPSAIVSTKTSCVDPKDSRIMKIRGEVKARRLFVNLEWTGLVGDDTGCKEIRQIAVWYKRVCEECMIPRTLYLPSDTTTATVPDLTVGTYMFKVGFQNDAGLENYTPTLTLDETDYKENKEIRDGDDDMQSGNINFTQGMFAGVGVVATILVGTIFSGLVWYLVIKRKKSSKKNSRPDPPPNRHTLVSEALSSGCISVSHTYSPPGGRVNVALPPPPVMAEEVPCDARSVSLMSEDGYEKFMKTENMYASLSGPPSYMNMDGMKH